MITSRNTQAVNSKIFTLSSAHAERLLEGGIIFWIAHPESQAPRLSFLTPSTIHPELSWIILFGGHVGEAWLNR